MLIVFGSRNKSEFLGPIAITCPSCGSAPCALYALRQKFTLFFIPTVTMSTSYIMKCGHCKYQWEINKVTAHQFQLNPQGPYGAPPGAPGASPAAGVPMATMNYPGRAPAGPGVMTCPTCGAATPPGTFCGACGAKLPPPQ